MYGTKRFADTSNKTLSIEDTRFAFTDKKGSASTAWIWWWNLMKDGERFD